MKIKITVKENRQMICSKYIIGTIGEIKGDSYVLPISMRLKSRKSKFTFPKNTKPRISSAKRWTISAWRKSWCWERAAVKGAEQ